MDSDSDINTDKDYLKKLRNSVFLGAIVSLISISVYNITGGEILCTAIENLISPNLMLLIATFALSLHLISVFFSCIRDSVEKQYFFATELAALLIGATIGLSIFYYINEFGLSYQPILTELYKILALAFLFLGILTALPFYIFMNYRITKNNYKDKKYSFIFIGIFSFSAVGIYATLFEDKIDDLPVCQKTEQYKEN
ncbi:hypothetical protein [Halomonas sp.]|uniref:hypothetical protein n=1 Tax=Halomonas sp. TaxID=1486246 RepID=UPI003F8F4996